MAEKEEAEARIELGDLTEDIAFLTRTIRTHLRGQIQPLRTESGIAPGDIGVLRIIELNPGISQNELAAAVVLKKSAVTKAVSELMARNLIEREQVASDRRFNALRLTKEGEILVRHLRDRVSDLHAAWLKDFSPSERVQLTTLLNRLSDAMEACNAKDG